ncbi:MAG: MnhB domain-containing protein [Desulfurococcus sp.]|uniref:MnhB domain-containing protein n=1 Tax=Desulfurococcus sp. TaxID=51678 RepID=UPI003179E8BE
MRNNYASIIIPVILSILVIVVLVYTGLVSYDAQILTGLAQIYLGNVVYPGSPWTSISTEVVTSVIWDQRGFDTYFETSVLFLAIVGSMLVLEKTSIRGGASAKEMTIIVRTVSMFIVLIIVVVSVSIALHGHLTPGGGFQGGSIFVIAPLVMLLVFGSSVLEEKGFTNRKLLGARSLAVSLIFLLGLAPVIYSLLGSVNAYLFQNLYKPGSLFSFPAVIHTPFGQVLLSGALFWLNLFEFLAVSTGFTLALMYLTKVFEGDAV